MNRVDIPLLLVLLVSRVAGAAEAGQQFMFARSGCAGDCSGNGVCDFGYGGGTGLCVCNPPWAGRDCSLVLRSPYGREELLQTGAFLKPPPPVLPRLSYEERLRDSAPPRSLTSHAGQWLAAGGYEELAIRSERNAACALRCPYGVCVEGSCQCRDGWFGPTCSERRCPNDCWGHGACGLDGICRCNQGWGGQRCEVQLVLLQAPAAAALIKPVETPVMPPVPAPRHEPPRLRASAVNPTPPAAKEATPLPKAKETAPPPTAKEAAPPPKAKEAAAPLNANETAAPPKAKEVAPPPKAKEAAPLPKAKPTLPPISLAVLEQVRVAASLARLADSKTDAISREAEALRESQKKVEQLAEQRAIEAREEKERQIKEAAEAAEQADMKDAAERVKRAIQRARSGAEELPGHDFYDMQRKQAVVKLSLLGQPVVQTDVAGTPIDGPVNGRELASPEATGAAIPFNETAAQPVIADGINVEPIVDGSNGGEVGYTPVIETPLDAPVPDAMPPVPTNPPMNVDTDVGLELQPLPPLPAEPYTGAEPYPKSPPPVANHTNVTNSSACGIGEYPCGPRGKCDEASARCFCEDGFMGPLCAERACPKDCSKNGICVGVTCLCEEGYFGDACQHLRCPEDCNNRGYCFQGRCQCSGDYGGESCMEMTHVNGTYTLKLPLKHAPKKGTAVAFLSTLRAPLGPGCLANCSGHGACRGGKVCDCDENWFGEKCSNYCPASCNGHGDCIHGACLCYSGYAGPACQTPLFCNGHGSKPNVGEPCECDVGWTGPECTIELLCPDPLCSGRGVCAAGQCICGSGYSGPSCNLNRPSCDGECGEHGVCNNMMAKCECDDGYSGRRCELPDPKCLVNDKNQTCSNSGTCMDGICSCWPGFAGDVCERVVHIAADKAMAPMMPRVPCPTDSADLSLLGCQEDAKTSISLLGEKHAVANVKFVAVASTSATRNDTSVNASSRSGAVSLDHQATRANTPSQLGLASPPFQAAGPLTALWLDPRRGGIVASAQAHADSGTSSWADGANSSRGSEESPHAERNSSKSVRLRLPVVGEPKKMSLLAAIARVAKAGATAKSQKGHLADDKPVEEVTETKIPAATEAHKLDLVNTIETRIEKDNQLAAATEPHELDSVDAIAARIKKDDEASLLAIKADIRKGGKAKGASEEQSQLNAEPTVEADDEADDLSPLNAESTVEAKDEAEDRSPLNAESTVEADDEAEEWSPLDAESTVEAVLGADNENETFGDEEGSLALPDIDIEDDIDIDTHI